MTPGKWLAGVASAVVIALIVGLLSDWYGIGGAPNRAEAHIVAFTQYGDRSNVVPTASISAQNVGKKTAEDCVIHWTPGMTSSLGVLVEQQTGSFALSGSEKQSITLQSPVAYGRLGTYTGTAWVACSNTRSSPKVATIHVLF
jgi:hypothetical protein